MPTGCIGKGTLRSLKDLTARVTKCIEAGALASGCTVEITKEAHYADLVLNEPLCERYKTHGSAYGQNVLATIPDMMTGSSDIGNVTYAVPTLHSMFSIPTLPGSYPHHPSFTSAAGTPETHQSALTTGKMLALLGWDVVIDDEFYEQVKSHWEKGVVEATV